MFEIRGDELHCECGHRLEMAVSTGTVYTSLVTQEGEVLPGTRRYVYSRRVREVFCPSCGKSWSLQEVTEWAREQKGFPSSKLGDWLAEGII